MPYRHINMEAFAGKQHFHVPAIGGIDSMNPKSAVQPGTLMDCLNYEVTLEAGYTPTEGLLLYRGASFDAPTRFYSSDFDDSGSTSKITDLIPGITYTLWKNTTTEIGKIRFLGTDVLPGGFESPTKLKFDLVSGDNDEISSFLSTASADEYSLKFTVTGYDSLGDPIYDNTGDSALYVIATMQQADLATDSVFVFEVDQDLNTLTLTDSTPVAGVANLKQNINQPRFSPDNSYVAVAHQGSSSGSTDISLYSFSAGTLTFADNLSLKGTGDVQITDNTDCDFNSDGSRIACSVTTDADLMLLSNTAGTLAVVDFLGFGTNTSPGGVAFSPTEEKILFSNSDGLYLVSSVGDTLSLLDTNVTFAPDRNGISWRYDGELAATTDGSTLRIISTAGDTITVLDSIGDSGHQVAWTKDGARIVTAQAWYSFDTNTNTLTKQPDHSLQGLAGVDASIDGEFAVVATTGNNVSLYTFSGGGYNLADSSALPSILWGVAFSHTSTSNPILIDDSTIQEDISTHTAYKDSYEKVVTALAAAGTSVPGTGAITGLFFHEDQLYAARDEAGGTYAELFTVANTEEQLTNPAWTQVDLGSEFKFKDGQGQPITVYDQEYLEETVDLSDPVEDRLGSFAKSVMTLNNINFYRGRWEPDSINNVLSDEEGDSRGAISLVQSSVSTNIVQPLQDYTHRLEITGFNIGDNVPSSNVSPVGIEVDVRFAFSTNGTIIAGTERASISHISLLGLGGTDDKASSVPTYDNTDVDTFRTVTLGGAADTWSATKLSSNNLFSDDFGVSLEFQGSVGKPPTTTAPAIIYTVPWVKVTVYFENGDSTVYFWDGAADNGNASLVNISLTEGTFGRKNAGGYMTVYDGTTLANVEVGDEIRTAANGAGNLLGVVDSVVSTNTLPSSTEMDAANSLMVTKDLNFFIDPEKEAIYGTTAASPAFQYNGRHFWYIHTPVPENLDTPRYLAEHQKTLVLSFDSGSVLISPAGQPNTFSGVLGAVEFGFSDRITGLINLNGNALGVIGKTKINAILGTSIQNFTSQSISSSSGALDYTVADIGQPTYLDFRGISNIQATQTYGDFSWGRLSQLVSKDIQGKIQRTSDPSVVSSKPVLAIPVKNKNQYRIYFADGAITSMTMFGPGGDMPMFTTQDYSIGNSYSKTHFVPTAYATRVDNNGREIIVIGLASGDIYVVDTGNPGIADSTEIVPYNRSLTFNPFFVDAPYLNIKFTEVMMHLRSTGYTDLDVLAGVNFLEPDSGETSLASDIGVVADPVDWEFPVDRVSGHLTNITDGFVFKVEGVSDGCPSHVIQALTYKGTALGDRNNSPKQY